MLDGKAPTISQPLKLGHGLAQKTGLLRWLVAASADPSNPRKQPRELQRPTMSR